MCFSLDEVLALKPDYIKTASPTALRDMAIQALENGISIVTLSIGALADEVFYRQVAETASRHNARIHIASGAIGGLDVLVNSIADGRLPAQFCLPGKGPIRSKAPRFTVKSCKPSKRWFLQERQEAIGLFPTKVNVAVAASIASVGPQKQGIHYLCSGDMWAMNTASPLKTNK